MNVHVHTGVVYIKNNVCVSPLNRKLVTAVNWLKYGKWRWQTPCSSAKSIVLYDIWCKYRWRNLSSSGFVYIFFLMQIRLLHVILMVFIRVFFFPQHSMTSRRQRNGDANIKYHTLEYKIMGKKTHKSIDRKKLD